MEGRHLKVAGLLASQACKNKVNNTLIFAGLEDNNAEPEKKNKRTACHHCRRSIKQRTRIPRWKVKQQLVIKCLTLSMSHWLSCYCFWQHWSAWYKWQLCCWSTHSATHTWVSKMWPSCSFNIFHSCIGLQSSMVHHWLGLHACIILEDPACHVGLGFQDSQVVVTCTSLTTSSQAVKHLLLS